MNYLILLSVFFLSLCKAKTQNGDLASIISQDIFGVITYISTDIDIQVKGIIASSGSGPSLEGFALSDHPLSAESLRSDVDQLKRVMVDVLNQLSSIEDYMQSPDQDLQKVNQELLANHKKLAGLLSQVIKNELAEDANSMTSEEMNAAAEAALAARIAAAGLRTVIVDDPDKVTEQGITPQCFFHAERFDNSALDLYQNLWIIKDGQRYFGPMDGTDVLRIWRQYNRYIKEGICKKVALKCEIHQEGDEEFDVHFGGIEHGFAFNSFHTKKKAEKWIEEMKEEGHCGGPPLKIPYQIQDFSGNKLCQISFRIDEGTQTGDEHWIWLWRDGRVINYNNYWAVRIYYRIQALKERGKCTFEPLICSTLIEEDGGHYLVYRKQDSKPKIYNSENELGGDWLRIWHEGTLKEIVERQKELVAGGFCSQVVDHEVKN